MSSSFVSVMPGADTPVPVLALGGHFEITFRYKTLLIIRIFLFSVIYGLTETLPGCT